MDKKQQPLITFVQYARNDGYAPNYEKRMTLSIQTLIKQSEDFKVPIEILIVEWNPPQGRRPLKSILPGSQGSAYATVRIITVPPQYHIGVKGATGKGLHPARALNVGYRRALGKFITPFASDSLLSNAVFDYAAKSGFMDDKIYRLDRYDIDPSILDLPDTRLMDHRYLFAECNNRILNHHAPQDEIFSTRLGLPKLHTNAAGDFLLMTKSMWHNLCGQPEDCDVACLDTDSITLHAVAASGKQEIRLSDACRVYKIVHANMSQHRVTPIWNWWSRGLSSLIRCITSSPANQAVLRGIFDIPRRQLTGIQGTQVSFERNFFLKAKRWANRQQIVKLNDDSWGLKGIELDETFS